MVALIRGGAPEPGGVWADLGAGTGNFTWALAEVLGPAATIHALDRDARAIAAQRARLHTDPPAATILPQQADVLHPLDLPPLDGIICANLLHFVRDQAGLLRRLRAHLRPGGRLLVVEYEQSLPIPWAPHPLPFARFMALAQETGFEAPARVGARRSPSSGRVMYAAVVRMPWRSGGVQ
ncbi:MAG: class I SAM-dependent methyltransferase [Oscillochloridaceae bacterium]|nr:class I SAM-dependent methyltransferase [Chloroflexaceae bacterium]MDW8389504.1 class I SAM-dependent methyltransferase [Oscillochloridaceae bacterium]